LKRSPLGGRKLSASGPILRTPVRDTARMANTASPPLTAADLRASIARERVRIYLVAARLFMAPGRLSRLLHERDPLLPDVAQDIAEAIQTEAQARRENVGEPRPAA